MNKLKTFPNGLQQLIRDGIPQVCYKHSWPLSDRMGITGNANPPCNSNCPLFCFNKEAMQVTINCSAIPVVHTVDEYQAPEEEKKSPIIQLK